MSLENTYSIIKERFENKLDLEPYPIIKSVDEHRKYWKPANVRIILLAESHVYTLFKEYDTCLNYDGFSQLDDCPTNYVRLVYCLGYGEKNIIKLDNNRGTPPFWKIFASCLYGNNRAEFDKIQRKTPIFKHRLENKIHLLEKIKENGIWLLDASIVALYNDMKKPGKNIMHQIISICWDQYVSHVISEVKPEKVIIIGHGVSDDEFNYFDFMQFTNILFMLILEKRCENNIFPCNVWIVGILSKPRVCPTIYYHNRSGIKSCRN